MAHACLSHVFTRTGRRISFVHGRAAPASRWARARLNAVYDKSAWLKEREIDASWPAAGLPETVHSDNGADFRSHAFAWACREEDIQLIFRPKGAPHYGGHIERLIGTTMGRVHFFPDRLSPNPGARQGNDPARFVAMTFREFGCALGWESPALQPADPQRAAPTARRAMARARGFTGFAHAQGPHGLLVSSLPDAHRTLRPDGIWLGSGPNAFLPSRTLEARTPRQVRSKGCLTHIRSAPQR